MGFQYRKSMKLGPIRVTASKRGLSYSAGLPGTRVTRRADGRIQHTASIPGSGLRYTTTSSASTEQQVARMIAKIEAQVEARARRAAASAEFRQRRDYRAGIRRRAQELAPMPRRMVIQRRTMLGSLLFTAVSFVVLPLLVLSVPCLLAALIMMLVNLPKDLAWWRAYKRAGADAYDESASRRT